MDIKYFWLLTISLLLSSCNGSNDEVSSISPLAGTWIGEDNNPKELPYNTNSGMPEHTLVIVGQQFEWTVTQYISGREPIFAMTLYGSLVVNTLVETSGATVSGTLDFIVEGRTSTLWLSGDLDVNNTANLCGVSWIAGVSVDMTSCRDPINDELLEIFPYTLYDVYQVENDYLYLGNTVGGNSSIERPASVSEGPNFRRNADATALQLQIVHPLGLQRAHNGRNDH